MSHLSVFDLVLWILGSLGQLTLLMLLMAKRQQRAFPWFFSFILYSLLSDNAMFFIYRYGSPALRFDAYRLDIALFDLLQVGVMAEIVLAVLRPVKQSLPRTSITVLIVMLLSGTALTLILDSQTIDPALTNTATLFIKSRFLFALLRLIVFFAFLLFSQTLGIGWNNFVAQLATGFGLYAAVDLFVNLGGSWMTRLGLNHGHLYHSLDQVRIVAWCLTLGYWSYFLVKKSSNQHPFTPAMERFLIKVSEELRRLRFLAPRTSQK